MDSSLKWVRLVIDRHLLDVFERPQIGNGWKLLIKAGASLFQLFIQFIIIIKQYIMWTLLSSKKEGQSISKGNSQETYSVLS